MTYSKFISCYDVPSWWVNFVWSRDTILSDNLIDIISHKLEPYNAWINEGSIPNSFVLNFDSEHDYLLFIMKYS